MAEHLAQTWLSVVKSHHDISDMKRQSVEVVMTGQTTREWFQYAGTDIDKVDKFGRLVLDSAARILRTMLGCQEVHIIRSKHHNRDQNVMPGQQAYYTVQIVR